MLCQLREAAEQTEIFEIAQEVDISDESFNTICTVCQDLEELHIEDSDCNNSRGLSEESYPKLKKLENLRKLVLKSFHNHEINLLSGWIGEVNEKLEDLEFSGWKATPEFLMEIARYLPGLKKFTMHSFLRFNMDCLKSFHNLEALEFFIPIQAEPGNQHMFSMDGTIFRNVKELKITTYAWRIKNGHAEEIAHNFPNLNSLAIHTIDRMEDDCAEIFLRELKQLKIFESQDEGKVRKSRRIVGCIKEHGGNLEKFFVSNIALDSDFVRSELKDYKGQGQKL